MEDGLYINHTILSHIKSAKSGSKGELTNAVFCVGKRLGLCETTAHGPALLLISMVLRVNYVTSSYSKCQRGKGDLISGQ